MKGIILAGGTGSRLFPLTKVTNKHLLPVGHYPMIFHSVAKLAEAGIQDILIVTGTEHMGDIVGVLGSGKALGLEFTYRVHVSVSATIGWQVLMEHALMELCRRGGTNPGFSRETVLRWIRRRLFEGIEGPDFRFAR